jgi:hypothetical protein
LSGDIGSLQTIGHTVAEQDVTGINACAMERIQLLHDGEISFNNFFTGQTDADHAHRRLQNLATTALVTYLRGTTLGGAGAGLVAKQFSYQLTRGQDGALLGSVNAKASGGVPLEWGHLIDEAAVATTQAGQAQTDELDLGAAFATIDRMAFYLHVTAFTGTTATILIQQDTADTFGSPTTYGTFAAVTAVNASERLAVAGVPERYLRWQVSGTFTTITFTILAVPLFD